MNYLRKSFNSIQAVTRDDGFVWSGNLAKESLQTKNDYRILTGANNSGRISFLTGYSIYTLKIPASARTLTLSSSHYLRSSNVCGNGFTNIIPTDKYEEVDKSAFYLKTTDTLSLVDYPYEYIAMTLITSNNVTFAFS